MFTIKWQVKDKTEKHTSPNIFTEERAEYLCKVANEFFDQAYHWMEQI